MWKAEPNGVYSTKSAYSLMLKLNDSGSQDRFSKLIWNLNIPPRAAVFIWRLLKDRLPTKGNLLRRHVDIQDAGCPLCGQGQEEVGHLFFNCKRTINMWWESMGWIKAVGPLPASPLNHFVQFCVGFGTNTNQSRWSAWWVALTSLGFFGGQHQRCLYFFYSSTTCTALIILIIYIFYAFQKNNSFPKGLNSSFIETSMQHFTSNTSI